MTVRVSTRDVGPTARFRSRRLIVNYVVFSRASRRWRHGGPEFRAVHSKKRRVQLVSYSTLACSARARAAKVWRVRVLTALLKQGPVPAQLAQRCSVNNRDS